MEEVLLRVANGDLIKRIDDSVIISFAGKREVLSSCVYNGGWRSDLQAVLNHHPQPERQAMNLDDYQKNMSTLCKKLGYAPERVATMGTGVSMKDVVIKRELVDGLEIIVVVTAGAEGNAGRAGDKAVYSGKTNKMLPPGTINIMVYFNAELCPGTMARAIVMVTEAKTAALQELMIGSMYSQGLATGTGTDQIIIIANPQGKYLVNDCGKHTKPGEMVGGLVKLAVKEALYKRNGYNGKEMHRVLRRMARFGITETTMLEEYNTLYDKKITRGELKKAMDNLDRDVSIVAGTSFYAHLLDQWEWNLLSNAEVELWSDYLLENMIKEKQANLRSEHTLAAYLTKWKRIYYMALAKGLNK